MEGWKVMLIRMRSRSKWLGLSSNGGAEEAEDHGRKPQALLISQHIAPLIRVFSTSRTSRSTFPGHCLRKEGALRRTLQLLLIASSAEFHSGSNEIKTEDVDSEGFWAHTIPLY